MRSLSGPGGAKLAFASRDLTRMDGDAVNETSLDRRTGGAARELDALVRTIELEIIPRLVLARRPGEDVAAAVENARRTPAIHEVAEFAGLVLHQDIDAATSFVTSLRTRGVSVESLYLQLLAPTARRLGDLWTADLCDFTEVTLGVGCLQRVLHELAPAFVHESHQHGDDRRTLLIPIPGEQHTFGLVMVCEFFRRAGWVVATDPGMSTHDLVALVRREWFAVVGISLSCANRLDDLATTIRAVRRASRNRRVGVIVGGPVFVEHPEFTALVGADATGPDGRQAVLQAQHLLTLLPARI